MDRGEATIAIEANRLIRAALVSFSVEDVQEAVGDRPDLLENFVKIANRKRREVSLLCEPTHRDLDDLDGKDLSVKDLFALPDRPAKLARSSPTENDDDETGAGKPSMSFAERRKQLEKSVEGYSDLASEPYEPSSPQYDPCEPQCHSGGDWSEA